MQEQIRQMREDFARGGPLPIRTPPDRGTEGAFRIRFDPSGDHLAVATAPRLRVDPWCAILEADGDLGRPALGGRHR